MAQRRGCGTVSFGARELEWVNELSANPCARRVAGKTQDRLERLTEDETCLTEEPGKPG
ncbi:MAG: hypothetical protein ACLP9L_25900 [Thermoguttaceae bacterium]